MQRFAITYLVSIVLNINLVIAENRWEIINPYPVAGDIVSLDFIDEEVGWLVTDGGLVMKTTDGGESWNDFEIPHLGTGAKGVDFINSTTGWILGGLDETDFCTEIIYLTTDSGNSWDTLYVGNQFQPCNITCLQVYDPENGWAAGTTIIAGETRPAVFRYTGEVQWDIVTLPGNANTQINGIHFVGRNSGRVVGQLGYTAFSNDGGRHWQSVQSGTELGLTSVHFSDPFNGWAVGGNFETGILLVSNDGGASWESQDSPAESRFIAIRTVSQSQAIAVSMGWNQVPAVIIQTENGEDWNQVFSNNDHQLLSMAFSGDNYWVAGADGFLIESANGNDWNRLSNNYLLGSVYDIEFVDEYTGWFVGTGGAAFKTSSGGNRWSQVENDIPTNILTATFLDEREGWLTAEASRELHTTDNGAHWEDAEIGNADVNLVRFNGDIGYATHGLSVSVTRNRGEDWASSQVIEGQQIPAISLSVPAPETAYLASRGDSLRRTTDNGESWHAVQTPFAVCYGASFIDEDRGWAVAPNVQGGVAVYFTGDRGVNWNALSRFDFNAGGIIFSNNSQGWLWGLPNHLYRTDDGGRTWTDMELGVNRIIRKVKPVDIDKIWICGDGGLVARWGDRWVEAPYQQEAPPGSFSLLNVYPNPTNGFVNLEVTVSSPGEYQVNLYNVAGRLMQSHRGYFYAYGHNLIPLTLSKEPAGVYLVRIDTNGRTGYGRATLVK